MTLSFSHPHSLGADEARRRLLEEAARQGVQATFDSQDEYAGEVAAKSPLGTVKARFRIGPAQIEVTVTKKPAFVPESMVQKELVAGLNKLLG